jgi:hypothetical protein
MEDNGIFHRSSLGFTCLSGISDLMPLFFLDGANTAEKSVAPEIHAPNREWRDVSLSLAQRSDLADPAQRKPASFDLKTASF